MFYNPSTSRTYFTSRRTGRSPTTMNLFEPNLQTLAVARDVLLEPFGLDESELMTALGARFSRTASTTPTCISSTPQRRLEPRRRHRQDRQLRHRPGRRRARGARREDGVRLFRRHLRAALLDAAAATRDHRAPRRRQGQGAQRRSSRHGGRALYLPHGSDRDARQHREGGAAREGRTHARAPRIRAWCR